MRAILFLVIALLAFAGRAELIYGRVVHVTDGDTIIVLDADKIQHKIRLAGIDAPEKSQAYGHRSLESLAKLVGNQSVVVNTSKRDRYGRQVGKVLVNGQDVNLEQIRRGMAWFYRQYEHELSEVDRQSYGQAETEARSSHKGLWADKEPVSPWDFRKSKRQE